MVKMKDKAFWGIWVKSKYIEVLGEKGETLPEATTLDDVAGYFWKEAKSDPRVVLVPWRNNTWRQFVEMHGGLVLGTGDEGNLVLKLRDGTKTAGMSVDTVVSYLEHYYDSRLKEEAGF